MFLFCELFEPVGDFLQAADPVFGLAGAGKLVILPMEEAQPGRNTLVDQSGVHLQTLVQRATVILIRMNEQRRGLNAGSIL